MLFIFIFIGNCNNDKFPLLRALNSALISLTNGEEIVDDGGECDKADYVRRVTRRPVVTPKPWSPPSTSSSVVTSDQHQDNLPSFSNSGE